RFFAFFNNVDETGEDGRLANAAPILAAPTRKQQQEITRYRAQMQASEAKLQNLLGAQRWAGIDFQDWSHTPTQTDAVGKTNELICLDPQPFDLNVTAITNLGGGDPFQVHGNLAATNGPLSQPALVFGGQTTLRAEALPNSDANKK